MLISFTSRDLLAKKLCKFSVMSFIHFPNVVRCLLMRPALISKWAWMSYLLIHLVQADKKVCFTSTNDHTIHFKFTHNYLCLAPFFLQLFKSSHLGANCLKWQEHSQWFKENSINAALRQHFWRSYVLLLRVRINIRCPCTASREGAEIISYGTSFLSFSHNTSQENEKLKCLPEVPVSLHP